MMMMMMWSLWTQWCELKISKTCNSCSVFLGQKKNQPLIILCRCEYLVIPSDLPFAKIAVSLLLLMSKSYNHFPKMLCISASSQLPRGMSCAAAGCKTYQRDGISFHRFPLRLIGKIYNYQIVCLLLSSRGHETYWAFRPIDG